MANSSLDKVIEGVKALSADEQPKVRELIDSILESSVATHETLSPKDLNKGSLSVG